VDTAPPAAQQGKDTTQRGSEARGAAGRARAAWSKAAHACDEAVPVEAAGARRNAAGALVRPDGPRTARAWAQQQRTTAVGALEGEAWHTGRRLLHEARTLHPLDWLPAPRAPAVPEPRCREAVVRLGYGRGHLGRAPGTRPAPTAPLVVVEPRLGQRLSPEWLQAYARVAHILPHTVRASRAGACMTRVLRMHQARPRHGSQSRLELTRLLWHGRPLTHGQRRGACPDHLLGLSLPTDAWWALLQMDPEELAQKLSTQEVMV